MTDSHSLDSIPSVLVDSDGISTGDPLRVTMLFLLFSSFLLLCHPPSAIAELAYNNRITWSCMGSSYTPNDMFESNLNTLLSSLASKSSSTATAGTGTDRTYGLYLCEGDLAPTDCQTCVQSASTNITQVYPGHRQAIIWYDYCMVRYSDQNFFGVPDTAGLNLTDPSATTTSPVPFQMVSNLVQEAPLCKPLMFASSVSAASSMYTMAQCTIDLTSANCSQCLNTILSNIKLRCTQSNGWRYLAPSCWIRYEATSFLRDLNDTSTEIVNSNCSSDSFPSSANANHNGLLSDLTTKALPTGFYNATTLMGRTQLNGLVLCRADLCVPSDDCSSCLTNTSSSLTTGCSNKKWGTILYEKCLLRYSDDNFFGVVDDGGWSYCGVEKVSSAIDKATVELAMNFVAVERQTKNLMFAANESAEGGGSQSQTSYVPLQCTRDLNDGECETCLLKGTGRLRFDAGVVRGDAGVVRGDFKAKEVTGRLRFDLQTMRVECGTPAVAWEVDAGRGRSDSASGLCRSLGGG